jgi:hypothetical protein
MIAALVGFVLYCAADAIEGVVDRKHYIHVRAVHDHVVPRSEDVHADAVFADGLMTLLRHRHLAGTEALIEAAQGFYVLRNGLFNGFGTVYAMKYDLKGLGHKHLSLFLLDDDRLAAE